MLSAFSFPDPPSQPLNKHFKKSKSKARLAEETSALTDIVTRLSAQVDRLETLQPPAPENKSDGPDTKQDRIMVDPLAADVPQAYDMLLQELTCSSSCPAETHPASLEIAAGVPWLAPPAAHSTISSTNSAEDPMRTMYALWCTLLRCVPHMADPQAQSYTRTIAMYAMRYLLHTRSAATIHRHSYHTPSTHCQAFPSNPSLQSQSASQASHMHPPQPRHPHAASASLCPTTRASATDVAHAVRNSDSLPRYPLPSTPQQALASRTQTPQPQQTPQQRQSSLDGSSSPLKNSFSCLDLYARCNNHSQEAVELRKKADAWAPGYSSSPMTAPCNMNGPGTRHSSPAPLEDSNKPPSPMLATPQPDHRNISHAHQPTAKLKKWFRKYNKVAPNEEQQNHQNLQQQQQQQQQNQHHQAQHQETKSLAASEVVTSHYHTCQKPFS